jgi:hypothetical protein
LLYGPRDGVRVDVLGESPSRVEGVAGAVVRLTLPGHAPVQLRIHHAAPAVLTRWAVAS